MRNILGVCGELYGLQIDSPDMRNPMGNLIKTEIEFGRSNNREYPIPASRSSHEHLGKQMAACRVRIPI